MSIKLYERLLKTYKGAKQSRKAIIALESGYDNHHDYKKFLEDTIEGYKVLSEEKIKIEDKIINNEELTDLVIAFDTTGSMGSYIAAVKNHVRDLIPKLFKENKNLQISIVAFGDYCDMINKDEFGKAYQVIGLTSNENNLINFINNAQNTGGGDGDEFYELVIKKITEETQWRKNSSKSVLLIADDNPHSKGYKYFGQFYQLDWKEEANKAKYLNIKFDTLRIKPNIRWYQELSDITGGVCLNFANSQKTADLVYATTLARGGINTVSTFTTMSTSDAVLADKDISAIYLGYTKNIKK